MSFFSLFKSFPFILFMYMNFFYIDGIVFVYLIIEKERKREISQTLEQSSNGHNKLELGQAKARSQKSNLGLPSGSQGCNFKNLYQLSLN